jgi:hypothetical protein
MAAAERDLAGKKMGHRARGCDGGAEEGDHAGPARRDRAQVALEVAHERLDPQARVLAGHRGPVTGAR